MIVLVIKLIYSNIMLFINSSLLHSHFKIIKPNHTNLHTISRHSHYRVSHQQYQFITITTL